MKATQLVTGRSALVILEPGDDVLPSLLKACADLEFARAVVSTFLGAFRHVTLIASHDPIQDAEVPLGDSVTVENSEGTGSGTVAPTADGSLVAHLHVGIGLKGRGGEAVAGHVLSATVQYPTEVVITEVLSPALVRLPNPDSHGMATLTWDRPEE